ncbi:hypothetical protein [Anaerolinea sp.]|uniref:hypothetical protein n=1 Tax=Anaerolinea sp. TaxID=1872519 RepID=UPI002ACE27F8|nr:hypothetical protein [Anaerolinea sp.]
MSMVVLQLPNVKRKTETRPKKCPYCSGETFQRWGKVRKPVRDSSCRSVQGYRYRCCGCRRTFRHYPQGVDRADQTLRLRKLAAIYWMLGMSLRALLLRLSEHWPTFRVFDWDKEVPWSNNGTERAIGRMQMRSRTVRGYKSWLGLKAAFLLIGSGLPW